ncbi:MAG: hypothetical protein ACPGRZ_17510, partial [Alphaproteobacteria bacterium]
MPVVITSPLDAATVHDYHAADVWRDETIYDIVAAHAAARPDAVALRSRYRSFTWAELVGLIDALAADLAARGHHVIRFDNRDCGLSTKFDG